MQNIYFITKESNYTSSYHKLHRIWNLRKIYCNQLQMQNRFDLLPMVFISNCNSWKLQIVHVNSTKTVWLLNNRILSLICKLVLLNYHLSLEVFPKKKIAADKHDAVIFYFLRTLQTHIPPHKQIILKYVIIKNKLVMCLFLLKLRTFEAPRSQNLFGRWWLWY